MQPRANSTTADLQRTFREELEAYYQEIFPEMPIHIGADVAEVPKPAAKTAPAVKTPASVPVAVVPVAAAPVASVKVAAHTVRFSKKAPTFYYESSDSDSESDNETSSTKKPVATQANNSSGVDEFGNSYEDVNTIISTPTHSM